MSESLNPQRETTPGDATPQQPVNNQPYPGAEDPTVALNPQQYNQGPAQTQPQYTQPQAQDPQQYPAQQPQQQYAQTPVQPQYTQTPVQPQQQYNYAQAPAQPQQPQYGQQVPGQTIPAGTAPAPQPAPAVNPGQSNKFMTALVAQWSAFVQIMKGYPIAALTIGQRVPMFWLMNFGLYSVLAGLFSSVSLYRTGAGINRGAEDLIYGLSGYSTSVRTFSVPFSTLFFTFLGGVVTVFLVLTLRALAVKWTVSVRRQNLTFTQAANNVAVSVTGQVLVIAAAFILTLIPSVFLATLVGFVSMALLSLLGLLSELLLYVSVNKVAPMEKSPLVPYVLFTALWIFLSLIAFLILTPIFFEGAVR